jgi:hypothetical protein
LQRQGKTRSEKPIETKAKIQYGSRDKKWILSRKMNGTRQETKIDFSIEFQTRFTQNTEVTTLPPFFDYWNGKLVHVTLSLILSNMKCKWRSGRRPIPLWLYLYAQVKD